eukprot:SAG31_NODE_12149_length_964_cov_0.942197_1_plen_251_part_00
MRTMKIYLDRILGAATANHATLNVSATAFLKELQQRLQAQYEMEYMQSLPPTRGTPPPAVNINASMEAFPALGKRLFFFSPPITEKIDANGNPESGEEISMSGGLNLTVAANCEAAMYICFVDAGADTMTPLPGLSSATVVGLPAGLNASIKVVRYKQKRLTMDGAVWASKPRLLVDFGSQPLPVNNITRCLWLEVSGPSTPSTAPMLHNVQVVLDFGTAQPPVKIPLAVHELAVSLPSAAPLWIGYMGM